MKNENKTGVIIKCNEGFDYYKAVGERNRVLLTQTRKNGNQFTVKTIKTDSEVVTIQTEKMIYTINGSDSTVLAEPNPDYNSTN